MDTTQVDSQPPEPLVHRNPTRTILWEFLQTVALTLLVFLVVNLTTARVRVSGPSMRPTLEGGEYIIVSKLSYRLGRPQRGDIVVFHSPDPSTSEDLIKRIVGLPGDTVEFVDGRVWLNGAALDEPYAVGLTGSDQTWKIGPDQLFVLGDNRAFSRDSAQFWAGSCEGFGWKGLAHLLASLRVGGGGSPRRTGGHGREGLEAVARVRDPAPRERLAARFPDRPAGWVSSDHAVSR